MIARSRRYFSKLKAIISLRKKIRSISYLGTKSGVVVFNEVGNCLADLNAEHYMAHLSALAGYKVKILIDDFQMEHWDYILNQKSFEDYKFHRSVQNRLLRGTYEFLSNLVFRHPNIEIIHYSRILKETEEPIELTEKDRQHAQSSVRKYFQKGEFDKDDHEQNKYYEVCLKNCEISKKVGIWTAKNLKPDLFVAVHGFYSAFGPACDYLEQQGYHCLYYFAGVYRPQTVHIVEKIYPFLHLDRNWLVFKNKELSEAQKSTIDEYFLKRFNGLALDTSMIFKDMLPKGNDINFKNKSTTIGSAKTTYGLFPNVIWDGDISERITIFDSTVDWIVSTILFFEAHKSLKLVVRFHPAETTILAYSKKLEPIIRKKIPYLNQIENVRVISSDEKINTYQLIQNEIGIGLIFEGMMALELPYLHKPAVVASRARATGTGVLFEPSTKEEYFKLLEDPEKITSDFENGSYRRQMYKFAYWYLFESCKPLPLLSGKKFGYIDYNVKTEDLDPAKNNLVKETLEYFTSFAN